MAEVGFWTWNPITTLPGTAVLPVTINPTGTPVSKTITGASLYTDIRNSIYPNETFIPPSGGDDYATIAAVLAAASDGDTIRLQGAYSTSDTLVITNDGITVVGYGATITQTGTDKATLTMSSVARCKVLGVHFIGKGTETPWAGGATTANNVCGVNITSSVNVEVQDCTFTNHAGGGIVFGGTCDGAQIVNNTIIGMGSPTITGGDNGFDGAIRGLSNSIAKTALVIAGNDISNHCFGIIIPGVIDMVVSNNFIHDIVGQHGMYLANGGDLAITGNNITDCAENGIKVQPQSEADLESVTNISCNTITRCGECGIIVLGTSSGAYYTKNVSIVGNNIYDVCSNASASSAGIFLREARKAHVAGNRVRKSGYYGLYAHLSEAQFIANYVAECDGCALYIDTPNNAVVVNGLVSVDSPLNVIAPDENYYFRSVVFMTDEASPNQGTVYLGAIHASWSDYTAKTDTGAFFSCLYPNANTLLQITGPIVDKTGPAYVIGTMAGAVENSIRVDLGNTAPTYGVNKAFMYAADVAAGRTSIHAMTEEGHIVKLFRGAAVADATGAGDVVAQLNALLARLRVTGGNGLIAD